MVKIVVTIKLDENGDMNFESNGFAEREVHPSEIVVGSRIRAAMHAEYSKILAESPHGGVEASGPNSKQIVENVTKQFHKENPR